MDVTEFRSLIIDYQYLSWYSFIRRGRLKKQILAEAKNNEEFVPLLASVDGIPGTEELLRTTFPAMYRLMQVILKDPLFKAVFDLYGLRQDFLKWVRKSLEADDSAWKGNIPQLYSDCCGEHDDTWMKKIIDGFLYTQQSQAEQVTAEETIENPLSFLRYLEALKVLKRRGAENMCDRLCSDFLKQATFDELVGTYSKFHLYLPNKTRNNLLETARERARTANEVFQVYTRSQANNDLAILIDALVTESEGVEEFIKHLVAFQVKSSWTYERLVDHALMRLAIRAEATCTQGQQPT